MPINDDDLDIPPGGTLEISDPGLRSEPEGLLDGDEAPLDVARQAGWPGSDSEDVRSLRVRSMTRVTLGDKAGIAGASVTLPKR